VIGAGIAISGLLAAGFAFADRRGWIRPQASAEKTVRVWQHLLALLVLAVANLGLITALLETRPLLLGDLRSHALVAHAIALGRVQGGWIDVVHGGFPLGPHYPSIAWLLSAVLMRLGLSPAWAVTWVGVGAVLATNSLMYVLPLRAGARFGAALVGAATLSWISPATAFLGGAPAILTAGALSQVVVVPFVLCLSYAVLARGKRWVVVLSAALVVAAHPQVAVATTLLLALLVVTCRRIALRRLGLAILVQAIVGGAIFGHGLATLDLPFGWPPMASWRVEGKPAAIFISALGGGRLLDYARPPVVTTVVAAAIVALLASARNKAARTSLLAFVTAVGLSVSGHTLARLGAPGKLALSFMQPLRAYLLVPICAAILTTVAVHTLERWIRAGTHRMSRLSGNALVAGSIAAVLALVASVAVPGAWESASDRHNFIAAGPCGPMTPPGFDADALKQALAKLSNGRLAYLDRELGYCAAMTGFEFASAVAIGTPFVVGAHVGAMALAAQQLRPDTPGADRRARALGIAYFLRKHAVPAPSGSAWRLRQTVSGVDIYELSGANLTFDLGCIRSAWYGTDGELRAHLFQQLERPESPVWYPKLWQALIHTHEKFTEQRIASDCDVHSATLLDAHQPAPGRYEADTRSSTPVDLIIRETAYRSWQFEVDGRDQEPITVAPGFMVIRIDSGDHHVNAYATIETAYIAGIGVASLLVLAMAFIPLHRRHKDDKYW